MIGGKTRAALAMVVTVTALAGCRSYAPRPLDLAAYEQAWQERSASALSVAAFAEELAAPSGVAASEIDFADGLTLAEAEAVAVLLNPEVRVLRLRAEGPRVAAEEAGRWDDPVVSFDALRVLSNVQDPWILGGGVGLTIPFSGRLAAARDLAQAEHGVAWREAVVAEWRLVRELEAAWLRWSATQREAALVREHVARLTPIASDVDRLVEAGELGTTDARLLRMQVARRRVEADELESRAERQRVALLAMLGLSPEAPIELLPTLDAAGPAEERNARPALHAHPELRLAEAAYETAEQALNREIRRQYPDLTIGPAAQWEQGQSRVGLGGSLPIPLWNRNTRRIREAEAAREAARAEAEAVLQDITHRLEQAKRHWEAARARRQALEREVAPLVDEQLAEVQRLIELGELDMLLLDDALARLLETKRAVLDARLEEVTAGRAVRAMVDPRWTAQNAEEE